MLIQCIAYFIAQYVGGQAMYRTERLGVYTAATRSCKPKKSPKAGARGDFKAVTTPATSNEKTACC